VSGVVQARAYENTAMTTGIISPESIGSLPAKSLSVVARGGAGQAIGDAIYARKPAGIRAWGTQSVTVTDEDGYEHTVGYVPATPLAATIVLSIAGSSSEYEADVKAALVELAGEYGVGEDLLHLDVLSRVLGAARGARGVSGTVNGAAISTTGALSVGYERYVTIAAGDITIGWT
jgi:uncharacterized phage protein gp47/JayE